MKTIVIGYGNTLRRDDGAGVFAVEEIRRRYPDVDWMCAHQPLPEMAEMISEYDCVIFMDATVESGTLRVRTLKGGFHLPTSSTHAVTPEALLAMAALLYGRSPRIAMLVELPAFNIDHGQSLSPATENSIHDVVQRFPDLIAGANEGPQVPPTRRAGFANA